MGCKECGYYKTDYMKKDKDGVEWCLDHFAGDEEEKQNEPFISEDVPVY